MAKTTKPYRIRPAIPWVHDPQYVGDDNQFEAFSTPAAVLLYVADELSPKAAAELWAHIIAAGASAESLQRDMVELVEIGQEDLATALMQQFIELAEADKVHRMDIEELDFFPPCLKGADKLIVQACAAITAMKLRERIEGTPVQLRDDPTADTTRVGLHQYSLRDVFPRSTAFLDAIEAIE